METRHPDLMTLFITWTTYGSWLPGDSRGWRKWKAGDQLPQPMLEDWCKQRMKEKPVVLNGNQRKAIEDVIVKHAKHRNWELHAVSVRSNHIHIAVSLVPKVGQADDGISGGIKKVRDQFKANSTRVLRQLENPILNHKVWTKGGDIQTVDSDEELDRVVVYITEAQDQMGKPKI